MSPDSQVALHRGDSVNIGIVKDNAAKTGRLERGGDVATAQEE